MSEQEGNCLKEKCDTEIVRFGDRRHGLSAVRGLFLSFTEKSAAAAGVLPLQMVVKGPEFSLSRQKGFEVGPCFAIISKAAFVWEPPEAHLLSNKKLWFIDYVYA